LLSFVVDVTLKEKNKTTNKQTERRKRKRKEKLIFEYPKTIKQTTTPATVNYKQIKKTKLSEEILIDCFLE
jgi:hypothetical protein